MSLPLTLRRNRSKVFLIRCSACFALFSSLSVSLQGCGSGSSTTTTTTLSPVLHKVEMRDQAEQKGAVCLDGSPGVFYWAPAQDPKLSSTWILFMEGGGWCYSPVDCTQRALTKDTGSTKRDAPTMTQSGYAAGVFNADPHVNPDFAGANHVFFTLLRWGFVCW